jgi:hypothetical protein
MEGHRGGVLFVRTAVNDGPMPKAIRIDQTKLRQTVNGAQLRTLRPIK